MEELDIAGSLVREDLFLLFKAQLKKDVEGAGLAAEFTSHLPAGFEALKATLLKELAPLLRSGSSLLPSLLYRVDISEAQLKKYQLASANLPFEELLAELIIKRVLQKVILKKKFSE